MIRKEPPKAVWDDLPPEQRVTEADFRATYATSPWMERHVANLANPRCHAAVWWPGLKKYAPCMACPPAPGERFCAHHNGPKKPKAEKPPRSRVVWYGCKHKALITHDHGKTLECERCTRQWVMVER